MAKKKAAKKGGTMGVVAAIVLLLVSILTFCVLAAPIQKTTTTAKLGNTTTENVEQITSYEFMEKMNEKQTVLDKDGNKVEKSLIQIKKEQVKKIDKDKLSDEEKKDLKEITAPITLYDTVLATEVLAAIALVASLLALIFLALKKGSLGFIFNLIAVLLVLAVFITACIMTAAGTGIADSLSGELLGVTTVVKSIAPILVLVVALLGTLVGGACTVLGKKK